MSSLKALVAAGVLATTTLFAAPSYAIEWTVDSDKSALTFDTMQNGQPLSGTFQNWTAVINFDPADPENGKIEATISTQSADTGNGQINQTLASDAWFNVAQFENAVFKSETIVPTAGNGFEAQGTLSIRGIELPLTLPFTLSIKDATAHAVATVDLSRTSYEMGKDISPETVPDKVVVKLDLWATR
ncbi:YceI family protein [Pseudovibrio sp. SPO723]|uniref:YceI family protein n=1 Tax=Nesiotobacter zosterae TaxID=392721 RepID=UPI0029C5B244|nr:YceI family protein [Pseudovibrio sp. SPO723]MDX5593633.1 YceI family protein [Pseudovibrio sp. SPO723]